MGKWAGPFTEDDPEVALFILGGTGNKGKEGGVGVEYVECGVECSVECGDDDGMGGPFVGDDFGRSESPMPEKRKCKGDPSFGQSLKDDFSCSSRSCCVVCRRIVPGISPVVVREVVLLDKGRKGEEERGEGTSLR